jgi:diguanylate cyclase (GGDEF)-like protein
MEAARATFSGALLDGKLSRLLLRLTSRMKRVMAFQDVLPCRIQGALTLTLVALIGLLDFLTGWELTFSVFYLAPILMVTWYGTRRIGVAVALLCAATWTAAYLLSQPTYLNPLTPYWNAGVRLAMFLLVVWILSALKDALKHEHELARTDILTGAANNRAFYERMDEEIARARRYKRSFTVAYVDIDDFKLVNDRFGHSVGDNLLRTVSETLRRHVRASDVVARLGGDEFSILFVETGYQMAERALNRLERALTEVIRANDWPISFSIGAVTCSGHVEGVDSVIQRADELMYAVKHSTKNDIRHERYHVTEQVA